MKRDRVKTLARAAPYDSVTRMKVLIPTKTYKCIRLPPTFFQWWSHCSLKSFSWTWWQLRCFSNTSLAVKMAQIGSHSGVCRSTTCSVFQDRYTSHTTPTTNETATILPRTGALKVSRAKRHQAHLKHGLVSAPFWETYLQPIETEASSLLLLYFRGIHLTG